MTAVRFEVLGLPVAQGSKSAFVRGGKAVMVESGKGHAAWRTDVAHAARTAMQQKGLTQPLDGPLALHVTFRFPCPASRTKAHRAAAERPHGAPKATTPDLDKLVRTIGDALTASGLIRDDARIWVLEARKVETTGWTGADILIGEHP